jgi:hypothetical protein
MDREIGDAIGKLTSLLGQSILGLHRPIVLREQDASFEEEVPSALALEYSTGAYVLVSVTQDGLGISFAAGVDEAKLSYLVFGPGEYLGLRRLEASPLVGEIDRVEVVFAQAPYDNILGFILWANDSLSVATDWEHADRVSLEELEQGVAVSIEQKSYSRVSRIIIARERFVLHGSDP